MATISFEIDAGAQTYTASKTVSGAHLTRLAAAYKVRLGLDEAATDQEVMDALFDHVFAKFKSDVRQYEESAARDAVADIDLT